MKIALITDLHISALEEKPMSIPVKEQFLSVLNSALKTTPDLLILNGDLCHKTGDKTVYEWIKFEITKVNIPCLGLPGNHDDPILMHEIFEWPITNGEMYYKTQFQGVNLIFLDSSSGKISKPQLSWLNEVIANDHTMIHFLFMHHPPILCNSLHMEPIYALENMDEVQKLLSQYSDSNFHIFCGHYHMEATVSQANMNVYITPSTFFQIDPASSALRKLNNLIGFRNIQIGEDKKLITSVLYPE